MTRKQRGLGTSVSELQKWRHYLASFLAKVALFRVIIYIYLCDPYGVARLVEKRLDTNLGVMDDSNLTEKVAEKKPLHCQR